MVGMARNLRTFPMNEIKRGVIFMQEKRLEAMKRSVVHPPQPESLPFMDWSTYVSKVKAGEALVLVNGLVHDVREFLPLHPGSETLLRGYLGTDATNVFFGRTQPVLYKHSHAAENLLSNMRVARMKMDSVPKKGQ